MLFKGFLIGFTTAATLGPIALLIIQRTLKEGRWVGLASGLGVALADAIYGLAGALGIAALTSLLVGYQGVLRVIGGLVLVYLGGKAAFSKINLSAGPASSHPRNWLGGAVSIFLLTLSNPMTIIFFSAVFAGISAGDAGSPGGLPARPGLFAMGVFAGSLIWWVILTTVISALRSRVKTGQLIWLNRVSGLAIAGFGIWVLVKVLLRA